MLLWKASPLTLRASGQAEGGRYISYRSCWVGDSPEGCSYIGKIRLSQDVHGVPHPLLVEGLDGVNYAVLFFV